MLAAGGHLLCSKVQRIWVACKLDCGLAVAGQHIGHPRVLMEFTAVTAAMREYLNIVCEEKDEALPHFVPGIDCLLRCLTGAVAQDQTQASATTVAAAADSDSALRRRGCAAQSIAGVGSGRDCGVGPECDLAHGIYPGPLDAGAGLKAGQEQRGSAQGDCGSERGFRAQLPLSRRGFLRSSGHGFDQLGSIARPVGCNWSASIRVTQD